MKKLPLTTASFEYLQEGFGHWLDVLGYNNQTVYALPIHAREFFHFLEQRDIRNLDKVSTRDFQDYYEQLSVRGNQNGGGGLSAAYLNKHLYALEKLREYLHRSGRHTLPWLRLARVPMQRQRPDIVTVEEIQELYRITRETPCFSEKESALAARDRVILGLFYGCGLRRNEGYHLDVSDVDFDNGIISVRKGKNYKSRRVPLTRTILEDLREYLYDYRSFFIKEEEHGALLVSMRGRRLADISIAIRLRSILERSDDPVLRQKEISLHKLRHSVATHLLDAGMSLEQIARFLGHSSLESTQIYTHLKQQNDDEGV